MDKLVIIDGNAIMHRAYHALPPLTNSRGQPINAVYGFASMLLKVVSDLKPTHLTVTFDRPTPTFRNELYKEYQSTREAMEDNLVSQIEPVHRLVKDLGIQSYEMDGYEADDLIGSLALKAKNLNIKNQKSKIKNTDKNSNISRDEEQLETIIVSGDRDMLQLVDEQTKVYMPVKGLSENKMYDTNAVIEKYGLKPSQFVDYKVLIGDPSDNYPGVAGIGPKTAANLLVKYQSLANILNRLKEIKASKTVNEKIITALEEGREQMKICEKLATIVKNAPIDINENKVVWHNNPDKIKEVLLNFGFKSLAKRFEDKKAVSQKIERKKDKNQLGLF